MAAAGVCGVCGVCGVWGVCGVCGADVSLELASSSSCLSRSLRMLELAASPAAGFLLSSERSRLGSSTGGVAGGSGARGGDGTGSLRSRDSSPDISPRKGDVHCYR